MTGLTITKENAVAKRRLADLIKDLRGNETQRRFARSIGVSYTSIQDWEKQIRLPGKKNLQRIAQLQGWTYDQLVLFLFASDAQNTSVTSDPFELIMTSVQKLTLLQKQQLRDYLTTQISEQSQIRKIKRDDNLNVTQKHNLHLLLRASLKWQDPLKAMEKAGLEPDLFADVFVRNDPNRQISYQELEKFSHICCRVIQWQDLQLPKIDPEQTYTDCVDELWDRLSGSNSSVLTEIHLSSS